MQLFFTRRCNLLIARLLLCSNKAGTTVVCVYRTLPTLIFKQEPTSFSNTKVGASDSNFEAISLSCEQLLRIFYSGEDELDPTIFQEQ